MSIAPPPGFRGVDHLTAEEMEVTEAIRKKGRKSALGCSLLFASFPPLYCIFRGKKLNLKAVQSLANPQTWKEQIMPRLREDRRKLMIQIPIFILGGHSYGVIHQKMKFRKNIMNSSLPDTSYLKIAAIENKPYHVVLMENGQLAQEKVDLRSLYSNSSNEEPTQQSATDRQFYDNPLQSSDYKEHLPEEGIVGGKQSGISGYSSRYASRFQPRKPPRDGEDFSSEGSALETGFQKNKEDLQEGEKVWNI
ncbi:uncharacterized protein LOC106152223 isoform X1 [Lingula anatina]|uniref:Uncharacterized protein LOC106152223 isoform X1 n=1 Tax=Lingula anatina TaxID=7574 RepID=A0A1S3H6T4_LINAN|nr:uncharacterized protein LOC106152223 isoform X1 [Lingula anatina]XP_013381191.1 uncharacterized protein LOC106152223 isoform X2 [Lingula anatina]XP_013381192.1 uncharacterized protein LOC106152223 isoform X1 [Lingula anatina]|eukprot:XP_013381190.1 uncharacterized protein LOC106152223 isoform X1 [Lingula anatina]